MTGALVAHAFASAGISTVLVEGGLAGRGSTAASSALLLQEPDLELTELVRRYGLRKSRRIWEMSRDSVHDLVALLTRLRTACDLQVRDAIYYAADADAAARLRREWAFRRARFDAVARSRGSRRLTGSPAKPLRGAARSSILSRIAGHPRAAATALRYSALKSSIQAGNGHVRIRTRDMLSGSRSDRDRLRDAGSVLAGRFRCIGPCCHRATQFRKALALGLRRLCGTRASLSLRALTRTIACCSEAAIDGSEPARGPPWSGRRTGSCARISRPSFQPGRHGTHGVGRVVRHDTGQPALHWTASPLSAPLVCAGLWRNGMTFGFRRRDCCSSDAESRVSDHAPSSLAEREAGVSGIRPRGACQRDGRSVTRLPVA